MTWWNVTFVPGGAFFDAGKYSEAPVFGKCSPICQIGNLIKPILQTLRHGYDPFFWDEILFQKYIWITSIE